MNATGVYDKDLQMFVEPEHDLNLEKLQFLRWMVEQGRLEHVVAGESSGECARQLKEKT